MPRQDPQTAAELANNALHIYPGCLLLCQMSVCQLPTPAAAAAAAALSFKRASQERNGTERKAQGLQ